MSKSSNRTPATSTETAASGEDQFTKLRESLNSPENFKNRNGDVVGFWDPELTPIQCIPLSVKLFDGNIDKDKPSILLTVELVKAAGVRPTKDGEGAVGQPFAAPPGSLVGVWYKPGMKAVRDLCGVEVFIRLTGEKDTGKPNPMKTFEVTSEKNGTRVPVTEDLRDKSKPFQKQDGTMGRLTDFDAKRPAAQANSSNQIDPPGVNPF